MNAPQAMKFGDFGINCFDIAKMEDFYTRVFRMVVADRGYVPPPCGDLIRRLGQEHRSSEMALRLPAG